MLISPLGAQTHLPKQYISDRGKEDTEVGPSERVLEAD